MDPEKKEPFAVSMENMKAAMVEMINNGVSLPDAVSTFRACYSKTAMELLKYNKCQAAKRIGIHRNSMARNLPPGYVRPAGMDPRRRA